ncbi:helix-turn-helix domain-containing protein [Xanthobacter autotrophicus DSM 431]|uniref:winged helix-turn-helix transcriptional regulator n=1 Tax=Xanthobacter nonsaccharivorans TaxID=3119912 RepID=UPI0037296AC5
MGQTTADAFSDAIDTLSEVTPVYCPMVELLDTLAGKWAFPILLKLIVADGPIRFGALQRRLGSITQKELTKQLRLYESYGLVTRQIFPEIPPRVEYEISDYGRTLKDPLLALAQWSATKGEVLFLARARTTKAKGAPPAVG